MIMEKESFREREARLIMEEELAVIAAQQEKEKQLLDLMEEEYQNQLLHKSLEIELIAYQEYMANSDIDNYIN